LTKGVCLGCERAVDLKNTTIDFCPHCGIGLFDHCGACSTRKSAFAKFCHASGAKGDQGAAPPAIPVSMLAPKNVAVPGAYPCHLQFAMAAYSRCCLLPTSATARFGKKY